MEWAGLTPTMGDKNSGGISRLRRSLLRSKGSQLHPHQAPIPGHQCQEKESPHYLTVKTSGYYIWERKRADRDLGAADLKGPEHILPSLTHSLTQLQHRGNSLKNSRGIPGTWGETKLTSFRVKAGGSGVRAALSRDWRCHGSFTEPSSQAACRQAGRHKSKLSINLANTLGPPTPCIACLNLFQWLFHTSSLPRLMLQTFLKSQRSTNNQAAAGLCALYLSLSGSPLGTSTAAGLCSQCSHSQPYQFSLV